MAEFGRVVTTAVGLGVIALGATAWAPAQRVPDSSVQAAGIQVAGPLEAPYYEDDFADPESGWTTVSESDVTAEYLTGEYHVRLGRTGGWWVRGGPMLGDFEAKVDGRILDSSHNKDFGLNFRMVDADTFYSLIANPTTGEFGLFKRQNGSWTALVPYAPTPALPIGESSVELRVKARGPRIDAWINGHHVAHAEDQSLAVGQLGLLVENNDDPDGADAFFDDLAVWPATASNPGAIYLPLTMNTFLMHDRRRPDPATPPEGIFGRATIGDAPAVGVALTLSEYGGDEQQVNVASTTTGPDGRYSFAGVASVPSGRTYYVRFGPNTTDPRLLNVWYGRDIAAYTAGQSVWGGDLELINIALASPGADDQVASPARFTWFVRPEMSDTYRVAIFNEGEGGTLFTDDLGRVNHALVARPPDIELGTPLGWFIRVYNGPDSFGDSFYYTPFRFVGPPSIDRAFDFPGLRLPEVLGAKAGHSIPSALPASGKALHQKVRAVSVDLEP